MKVLTKLERKLLRYHLASLHDQLGDLMEKGHTFWHCDAVDEEHNMPFYYFQRNLEVNMSTCSTCYKMMAVRNKIRRAEKILGRKHLTPIKTRRYYKRPHTKHVYVTGNNMFDPNQSYLGL